jgi:hypothetical protein
MSSAKVVRALFKNQSYQTLAEPPYPRHHPPVHAPDAHAHNPKSANRSPILFRTFLSCSARANSKIGAPLLIPVMKLPVCAWQ